MYTSTSEAPTFAASSKPAIRPRYSATLLVAMSDGLLVLGEHRTVIGRPHHRPVPGRPRVTARSPVGLDDDLHAPVPLTRNRIAPHSGQRSTSSSAAAEIRASSPRSISMRHAPHRRPCSSPAPGPPRERWRSYSSTRSASSPATISSRRETHWWRSWSISARASSHARLRVCEVVLQVVDLRQLAAWSRLQLLAPLHHLQQRVLEAGLAAFQGLKLVLQVR